MYRFTSILIAAALSAGPALAQDRWMSIPDPAPMPEPASSGMAPVNGIEMYYATYGAGDPVIGRSPYDNLRLRLPGELADVRQHMIIRRQFILFGEPVESGINVDHKSSDKGIFFSPGISDRKHCLVFGVYNDENIGQDAAVPISL